MTLKELIAECRIEPTENGKIYVHPEHGKRELPENIRIARWRAEQFGEEIILIPNPQNIPTPDSYNITRGIKEEYKHSNTPTLNAIDRRLRDASHQAEYVIFEIDSDINSGVVTDSLKSRMRRCGIKEVRIKIGEAEAIYTREQILNKDFKIKPEDFHNVSDFRSRGSSQKRGEPNIDAKLAHFFGLDKKSLKQIAEERHAARTPEQIQAIKDAWEAKKQRDANTKLLANNVFKLKTEYPLDIDFSDLEKYIQQGELKKMRAEAKKVGQTILAVKKEEQMLSDLLPEVHNWHKKFSITELKEAHAKVQSTLDYWKAKGYDLATNSNLSILKTEIEQKIKFVENPGAFKAGLIAHKTWQVQQNAYKELLGKVEVQIELNTLQAEYQALLGFSTTSKDFKNYMAKAKAALDVSDSKNAKFYINLAKK